MKAHVKRPRPKAKPKPKVKKVKGKTYWIMRYYSSRGTDYRICVALPKSMDGKAALEIAKDWAQRCTANSACYEYTVTVESVRVPPRGTMVKRFNAICKQKKSIEDRYRKARAMMNTLDWTKQRPF